MGVQTKNPAQGGVLCSYGAPGEIRTPDRLVRSQVLYPAELRARKAVHYLEARSRCQVDADKAQKHIIYMIPILSFTSL